MEKKIRIVTHNGRFHVDDLFAVAALQIYLKDKSVEVIRSRDPEVIASADFVVDVGGVYDPKTNRFDHHQHGGAGGRENGVPYSSLGLVWKHYGEALAGSVSIAEVVDRGMVMPIDMADNGIEVYMPTHEGIHPYLLHRVLSMFRPTWKEGDLYNERFAELLTFARRLIEREIFSARDEEEGIRFVEDAYQKAKDKRLIVLDGPYPWHEYLSKKTEPLYVIKPKAQKMGWELEVVRDDAHRFANRTKLPESWCGKFTDELSRVTGVPDAVFCHNNGWVAVTQTKEGALKLAEIALKS